MPAAPAAFGTRLGAAIAERGRLCVGIDPHASLLHGWGLGDDAAGARELGLRVVDAAAGRAAAVKPQAAFFERHGAAGYAALEEVLVAARAAGLVVIADAKRGDIGSTVEAYGEAWLRPGSPLESDAMTVVAYQGVGSLDAVRSAAAGWGKGLFVLAATSNPESAATQRARREDGATVAAAVVDGVAAWNTGAVPQAPADGALGSFGVVIGATVDLAERGIAADRLAGMPVLAPGFGFQGARIADGPAVFGAASSSVLVVTARAVLQGGPAGLADAIGAAAREAAW